METFPTPAQNLEVCIGSSEAECVADVTGSIGWAGVNGGTGSTGHPGLSDGFDTIDHSGETGYSGFNGQDLFAYATGFNGQELSVYATGDQYREMGVYERWRAQRAAAGQRGSGPDTEASRHSLCSSPDGASRSAQRAAAREARGPEGKGPPRAAKRLQGRRTSASWTPESTGSSRAC